MSSENCVENAQTSTRPVPSLLTRSTIMSVDNRKALRAGLTFRPLKVAIKDTLEWDLTRVESDQLSDRPIAMAQGKIGLTPEREMELLESWHKTH